MAKKRRVSNWIEDIFQLSRDIRYVATYVDGKLHSQVAGRLQNASTSDTDRFEELLVNPAVLLLAKQRGDIDCGGLSYVLIRYGNFFQFVRHVKDGHLSVCIEPTADPLELADQINELVAQKGAST